MVARAADAGLRCIEWGGDVHVPPGRPDIARRVRALTEDAGLAVASYGSYFRTGTDVDSAAQFGLVLESARALGAPRIRIWAGSEGSAQTSGLSDLVRMTRKALLEADRRTADEGIDLAFEFHGGTFTDTAESALRLIASVDQPRIGSYWQPPNGMPDAGALEGLRLLLPVLRGVHVFSWWPDTERLPLTARADLWRAAISELTDHGQDLDLLLEFVPDDDPDVLRREAATLRSWITEARRDREARHEPEAGARHEGGAGQEREAR
ncbi:sugar phosphate isomerase/epimerase family protein [Kineosporia succinea]|uniref:sugar phosphate isomerase/epimerase family protein n=1 Tax=Kineosporia succinea TaxID=84632 RepID=UPI0027D8B27E|nr:TIM barrel protein [Kineosporia succinea]